MSNTKNLLRIYNTKEEYEDVKCNLHEYTISYIEEDKEVEFQEESYLVAKYNITSTTSNTQLLDSSFDISQITEMYIDDVKLDNVVNAYMFETEREHTIKMCTKCITTCNYMFTNCSCLTSLDLSLFDTSNVTTMENMFYECRSLTSIEFGNKANMSNITDIGIIFYKVPSTCELKLCSNTQTSWDTLLSKVSPKPSTITYVECTEPTSE